MSRIKKILSLLVISALFSASVLVSCGKQSDGTEADKEQSSSDSTEHPSDSTEHPAGEHPADTTKN